MTDLTDLLKNVRSVVGKVATSSTALALVPEAPKRRASVVAHDGFKVVDTYQAVRPQVFAGSLAVALGATVVGWMRRERGTEAVALWGGVAALAGLAAYLTRPGAGTGTGASNTTGTALESANRWLDARAQYLDRVEPGWEQQVQARVMMAAGA